MRHLYSVFIANQKEADMRTTLIRTPSDAEINAGIANGKRERAMAIKSIISGIINTVRMHFEWRENMSRTAISARCPDCSC